MTISKGEAWGEPLPAPGDMPEGIVIAHDDPELASLAAASVVGDSFIALGADRRAGSNRLRGDVARTLGVDRERETGERLGYRFDLGFAELDGSRTIPFIAHLVARGRFWGGEVAVAMNCAWMGPYYLGPRAHPNDGLLDLTVGRLRPSQRWLARGRARSGSHLPHPDLSTSRRASWEHRFERSTQVYADGVAVGVASSIRLWLEPDCFTLLA